MRASRQRGFSLIEILVAFTILALTLGVLLKIFSSNLRLAAVSDDYATAVLVAESVLAELSVGELQEGHSSDTFNDRFRWSAQISEFQPDEEQLLIEHLPLTPYHIELTVEWGDEIRSRSLTMNTLRLQPKSRSGPR